MAETEMVERVARAIAENLPSPYELDTPWATGGDYKTFFDVECAMQHEGWRNVARAAIEAMREPTDAMKNAAAFHDISFSYGDEESFEYVSEDDAGSIFTTMIDAALSHPSKD